MTIAVDQTRSQPLGPDGPVWIDHAVTAEGLTELAIEYGLGPAAVEDVMDVEQLPKFEQTENHLFVILHGLSLDGERLDTIEIDCFVSDDHLLTLHQEPVPGVDWLWEKVAKNPHLTAGGPSEVFGHLCEAVGRRFLSVADELELQVDGLGDDALAAAPHLLAEVQLLRREEATIRKMLTPQMRMLNQLSRLPGEDLNERARRQLVDAYDVHNQVLASLATSRQLLSDMLDTYRGAVAERQGRAANLLTVYAAIVLPMTLIAGWYGMNTANLPAADREWGWIIVTVVMVLVGVASWVWFARLGIASQPRLVKPIGKGLAAAARAPLRPVTMLRRDHHR